MRADRLVALSVLLPGTAYAQEIPTVLAVIILSPLLVFLMAIALGVLMRSWKTGATHAGLVVVWIVLTGIAAYWVENDYVIWTPLALYVIHSIILLALIIRAVVERRRS